MKIKRLFALLLSILLFMPVCQVRANDIPDIIKANQSSKSGKVWVATEYEYREKNSNDVWVTLEKSKDTYDSKGRLKKTASKYYDDDGKLTSSTVTKYAYNKNNKLKTATLYGDKGKSFWGKRSYKYDSKGRLTKVTHYDGDKVITRTKTIKYKKGLPSVITIKYSDGGIQKTTYKYNNKNKLIKTVVDDIDCKTTTEYKYSKGKVTKATTKIEDSEGENGSDIKYKYDTKGRLIESKDKYSAYDSYGERTTTYNTKGFIKKIGTKYAYKDSYYDNSEGIEYHYGSREYSYKYYNSKYLSEKREKLNGKDYSIAKYSGFKKIPAKYANTERYE